MAKPKIRSATGFTVEDKLRDSKRMAKAGEYLSLLGILDRTMERAERLHWLANARSHSSKADGEYLWQLREDHVAFATGLALLLWPRAKGK